jgi:hypothetical protein
MSQGETTENSQEQKMTALSREEIGAAISFFQERLVGQPEVVQTLSNVLYKQNALLKRILEHGQDEEHPVGVPADPTVLLFLGGSWGKSLATRLIAMALSRLRRGSLTVLTPLPQDPEGRLNIEPRLVAAPFSSVVIENVESVGQINARFVANLAHLLDSGVIAIVDPVQKAIQPIPLGLCTFIMTTNIADKEIREVLNPVTRLGFLQPADEQAPDADAKYLEVQQVCMKQLDLLPHELLRTVDETVVLRPLSENDLRQVFDLEIEHFQQAMFPGQSLPIVFEGEAKESLFDEARDGLGIYGAHALRRVLQRHVDPVVYRAYNEGILTEDNLPQHQVMVRPDGPGVDVELAP